MKHYVLFTDEELEALNNGEEIEHYISGVGKLYFMSKEEFQKTLGDDDDDTNDENDIRWGNIYEEFKSVYPHFVQDVVDYRPYCKPYASENNPLSILLYMKNGDKKRYSYTTKRLYPVYDE